MNSERSRKNQSDPRRTDQKTSKSAHISPTV
jgi:hypothetical protein